MERKERVNGKYNEQISFTKLRKNPFQVYLKQISPKYGLEVLYKEGENEGKALVNTNGFPWVNLHLDPQSAIMRKDQHHTILDSGFELVISILEHLFDKYNNDVISMLKLREIIQDGKAYFHIEFTNPHFKILNYTVKDDENIIDICDRLMVSEFMVLELNPKLDDYDDVEKGQIIKIPNDYAPKMELLIDKINMVPVSVKVFDNKGLYEYFIYKNVIINPPLTDADFDKDYKEYGF